MQSRPSKKAIIIGGGIGGIAAAIALRRAGIEATVFERAPELREVGSGLPLWTNALRALQKLGVADALETLGAPVTAGFVTTWQGDILADLRTEKHLNSLGTINTAVHRAELLDMLLKALGPEHVHLNATCVGCTQDATGVWARFADGTEAGADLLIGADGIHSVIRSYLFGLRKPRYVGYTCWRGVAHISRSELETWAWGKGYQFGITPMSNGRAYWFAQHNASEGEQDQPLERKRALLTLFHDWHDPIPAVIEATQEVDILRNDVYELVPLPHWSRGRITLLGDAAHAMTPNLGQGACLALEDAVELAQSLKDRPEVAAALKLYERRRLTRAHRVARLARLMGPLVQMENSLTAQARNAIVKRMPESMLVKQLMWILNYEV